jgi:hypothetical protein
VVEPGPGHPTPPRLSFVDAQVSFWRPGAEDWVAARVNTPLAPGDELYTGAPGNLELQVGTRAWVRAWANTQLGLANLEPDYLQLKVTTGHVSLDIRRLDPGHTVEVDTPNGAFTIERTGYYRLTVTENRTSFITRRGGRATVTPANGPAAAIAPSEEVVVWGTEGAQVATYVAPPLDEWDRWNYARTDQLIDSVSARYVSGGIYGIDDLDHYGSWRVVEPYGPVWLPDRVPAGWAPYSTGAWTWYPGFGWTWVDTAPWGWAPYHYGRWVFVSGYWAWAPGPILATPVYAPALVAFLGGRPGVTISIAGPAVGWVALGWGEPLIPWWGPVGFIGVPWWAGWGGPRIVNNLVVTRTTVVTAAGITTYRNISVREGVVVVPRDRFGRGPVTHARVANVDPRRLEPIRETVGFSPVRTSLTPDVARSPRPPEATLRRPVVSTRPTGQTRYRRGSAPGVRSQHDRAPPSATAPGLPASDANASEARRGPGSAATAGAHGASGHDAAGDFRTPGRADATSPAPTDAIAWLGVAPRRAGPGPSRRDAAHATRGAAHAPADHAATDTSASGRVTSRPDAADRASADGARLRAPSRDPCVASSHGVPAIARRSAIDPAPGGRRASDHRSGATRGHAAVAGRTREPPVPRALRGDTASAGRAVAQQPFGRPGRPGAAEVSYFPCLARKSGPTRISRGFAPCPGPMMRSCSIMSMKRAALG